LETQRVPCRAFFECTSQAGAASLRSPITVVRSNPRVRRDLPGRSLRFGARTFKLRRILGDGHDFGFDRCFDYYCCRRDLLLGHRKICPRFSIGKSSQAACGADLSGSPPSTGSPDGRNWRAVTTARSAGATVARWWHHCAMSKPRISAGSVTAQQATIRTRDVRLNIQSGATLFCIWNYS
jgi:hypothetical protein